METASATPAARLDLLDALRGFALLGVLLANLRDFSLHQFLLDTSAIQDGVAQRLMAALLDAKAATLFSLLFGVGFAMQMRARADAARRYRRRLLLLLLIGLAHAWLLWWGDILRYYALLGLLLLPMARWSPRRLALAGIVVALFAAPLLAPFAKAWLPAVTPHARAAAEALAAFSGPDPGRAWVANLDYDLRMRLANWSLAGFVLGRLMVGAALGATTLFSHPHERRRAWLGILAAGLAVGMPATAFALLRDQQILFNDGWWASADARRGPRDPGRGLALARAGLYGGLRAAVPAWPAAQAADGVRARRAHGAQQLSGAKPDRRRAVLRRGAGFGPARELSPVLLLGLALFATQSAGSAWWLRRFHYGPCEWLWRSATCGSWQALRRRATAVNAPQRRMENPS